MIFGINGIEMKNEYPHAIPGRQPYVLLHKLILRRICLRNYKIVFRHKNNLVMIL